MRLDVPYGSTFYWNPYSPKYYTIVGNNSLAGSSRDSSDEEGSINPIEDDEYDLGWAAIASVRTETTDSNIQAAIQRLPYRTLQAVLSVLENSPSLMTELCEKERGNVVSHVMATLGGERCPDIAQYAIANAKRLALNQSGCIAFTRIFDAATKPQRERMSRVLVPDLEELITHQYGNFVVSRLLQDRSDTFASFVADIFESPDYLFTCIENKFGSHVYENFIKNANPASIFRVATVLLANPASILQVATSKIANYPLQATLKTILLLDSHHELSRWALEYIPGIVANTQFALNINRSLGFRPTTTADHPISPKSVKTGGK